MLIVIGVMIALTLLMYACLKAAGDADEAEERRRRRNEDDHRPL